MKKRNITLIISLMSFALLGVVAMQLYFLRQSYDMQSKLFDRSVNEALDNVVTKLTRQDANKFLSEKAQRQRALENQAKFDNNIIEVSDKDNLEKNILIKDSVKTKK